jgi:hypothetical protein
MPNPFANECKRPQGQILSLKGKALSRTLRREDRHAHAARNIDAQEPAMQPIDIKKGPVLNLEISGRAPAFGGKAEDCVSAVGMIIDKQVRDAQRQRDV